jgi:hypothetical protein
MVGQISRHLFRGTIPAIVRRLDENLQTHVSQVKAYGASRYSCSRESWHSINFPDWPSEGAQFISCFASQFSSVSRGTSLGPLSAVGLSSVAAGNLGT